MVNKTLRNNKPVPCCQVRVISVLLLLEEINLFSQFRALFCIILQLETFVLSHSLFVWLLLLHTDLCIKQEQSLIQICFLNDKHIP